MVSWTILKSPQPKPPKWGKGSSKIFGVSGERSCLLKQLKRTQKRFSLSIYFASLFINIIGYRCFFFLRVERAAKEAATIREAQRIKELEGMNFAFNRSSFLFFYTHLTWSLKGALPQEMIEEYKPEDDTKIKEALTLVGQMNKTVDEVVLKMCNEIADAVLKGDWQISL